MPEDYNQSRVPVCSGYVINYKLVLNWYSVIRPFKFNSIHNVLLTGLTRVFYSRLGPKSFVQSFPIIILLISKFIPDIYSMSIKY